MTLPEHAICSALLAQFGVRQRLGTAGVVIVTVAGVAPDLDVVSKLFGDFYFWKLHHALGHNVIAIVVLSAVIASIGRFAAGVRPFGYLFGWCCIAAFVHCLTDTLYWFAVKPFWPISQIEVSFDILEYLDLIVLAIWFGGAVCLYKTSKPVRVAGTVFGILTGYVALRAILPAPTGLLKLITGDWMYAAPKDTPVLDWW